MGNYRAQYEKYYGNIKGKGRGAAYRGPGGSAIREVPYVKNNVQKNNGSNIVRKFLWQLTGSLLLLLIFLIIKMIPLEGSREIYAKSKEVLNEQFNLSEAIMSVDIPEVESYKESILDYIDSIKSSVSGQKTLKEKIKDEFIVPTLGTEEYVANGEELTIETDGVKDVYASFDGVISEVKDDEVGKHIIINHDNGIETYYAYLSESSVEVGEKVEKGTLIGKSGQIESKDSKGILFKIIYMGNEKNPNDMMDLSSIEKV